MWSTSRALLAAFAIVALPAALADAAPKGKGGGASKPQPPPPPEAPKLTPEQARAVELFDQGRDHLAAKEYEAACTAFQDSQQADPAVGTQLNLGLCLEEWGKTRSAVAAYAEAERLAEEKHDDRAAGAKARKEQVAQRVPHLAVTIPTAIDAAATFTLDAQPMTREQLTADLTLDPGTHVIEVAMPGREPVKTTVVVVDGDRKQVTLEVPVAAVAVVTYANERSAGRFYGGIGIGVVGVGALAAASILALGARSDYQAATANCQGTVCATTEESNAANDARDTAKTMTYVAAGGVVLVGVGVALILTSHQRVEHRAIAIAPVITGSSLGFAIGGAL